MSRILRPGGGLLFRFRLRGLFGFAAVCKRLQYARVAFVGLAGWIVDDLLHALRDVVQGQLVWISLMRPVRSSRRNAARSKFCSRLSSRADTARRA